MVWVMENYLLNLQEFDRFTSTRLKDIYLFVLFRISLEYFLISELYLFLNNFGRCSVPLRYQFKTHVFLIPNLNLIGK